MDKIGDKGDINKDAYFEEKIIVVDPEQSPIRIDRFIVDKLQRVSRSKIQKAIELGSVLVNNKVVKVNYKVMPNDKLVLQIPRINPTIELIPEKIDLDIRYEDDDLLIIHKPPGLVMHPGVGNRQGTLVNGLLYYLNSSTLPINPGNDVDRPGIVHRIDKDTSGLVVIAKTDQALTDLAKQFFNHTVHREYQALVWGEPVELKGTINGHIGRNPKNRQQMLVFGKGEEGKHAITHYEVIEELYYVSLVKCKLETGRTHQIRAHFKYIGHPIFNDERYGGHRIMKGTQFTKYKQFVNNCFQIINRQALHAKSLGFIHPTTKKEVFFDSDLPDDMSLALDKWRKYLTHRRAKA